MNTVKIDFLIFGSFFNWHLLNTRVQKANTSGGVKINDTVGVENGMQMCIIFIFLLLCPIPKMFFFVVFFAIVCQYVLYFCHIFVCVSFLKGICHL